MAHPRLSRRAVRGITITIGTLPLFGLLAAFALDRLGANPVEEFTHATGKWALRLLILTLVVTPLRRFFGWNWLSPERRSLGLLAFLYAAVHFATYLALDLSFDLGFLGEDLVERPYIMAGFAAFCAMLPLALTSTRRSIKRLGRRWMKLHRLIYLSATAAAVHFVWLTKADYLEPGIYAGIVAILLVARIPQIQPTWPGTSAVRGQHGRGKDLPL